MPKFNPASFAKAQSLVASAKQDIRDADALGVKPKIRTERAKTHAVKRDEAIASVSLNDILDSMNAAGLLLDPLQRKRFLRASAYLNSAEL